MGDRGRKGIVQLVRDSCSSEAEKHFFQEILQLLGPLGAALCPCPQVQPRQCLSLGVGPEDLPRAVPRAQEHSTSWPCTGGEHCTCLGSSPCTPRAVGMDVIGREEYLCTTAIAGQPLTLPNEPLGRAHCVLHKQQLPFLYPFLRGFHSFLSTALVAAHSITRAHHRVASALWPAHTLLQRFPFPVSMYQGKLEHLSYKQGQGQLCFLVPGSHTTQPRSQARGCLPHQAAALYQQGGPNPPLHGPRGAHFPPALYLQAFSQLRC